MPEYLYQNPITLEVVSVFQRMLEPHVYEKDGVKYNRVFTIPQGAIDTKINPDSSKDFVEKMGRKRCTLGDMMDTSKELSERRVKSRGKDKVKEEYYRNYSKRRKNRPHPDTMIKNPSDIQVEIV